MKLGRTNVVSPFPTTGDDVECRRKQGSERSARCRELRRLYGKGGYRITRRVTPSDVLSLLAQRYRPIDAALKSGDAEELGQMLDALEEALAYGELGSFDEAYGEIDGE